jgi:hypothetical protein
MVPAVAASAVLVLFALMFRPTAGSGGQLNGDNSKIANSQRPKRNSTLKIQLPSELG